MVHNEKIRPKALIIEDNPHFAHEIQTKLISQKNIDLNISTTFNTSKNLIKNNNFDIISIDWQLGDRYLGDQILKLINRLQPYSAKVVFTIHRRVKNEAEEIGNDAFLIKEKDNNLYPEVFNAGISLSLSRKICSILNELGKKDLPKSNISIQDFSNNKDFDKAVKETTVDTLLKLYKDSLIQNTDDINTKLEGYAFQKGWWKSLNPFSFSDMDKKEKVFSLIDYYQINLDDFSKMVEIMPDKLDIWISRNDNKTIDSMQLNKINTVIALLFHILKISDFEPLVAKEYFNSMYLFNQGQEKPPWSGFSIRNIVIRNGYKSAIDCLTWLKTDTNV